MATKVSALELVPSAIVLAVVGWYTWPYLGPPELGGADNKGQVVEIAQSLLSPTIEPASARNPFKRPGAAPSGRGGVKYVENEQITRVLKVLGDVFVLRRATPRVGTAPRPGPMTKPNLAELLSTFSLSATWVQGPRRAAVINGRIYRQGDAMEAPAATPAPLHVAQVFPDRVLLECQGARAELRLPEQAERPSGPAVAAPPAPHRPTTPPHRPGPRLRPTRVR